MSKRTVPANAFALPNRRLADDAPPPIVKLIARHRAIFRELEDAGRHFNDFLPEERQQIFAASNAAALAISACPVTNPREGRLKADYLAAYFDDVWEWEVDRTHVIALLRSLYT